MEKKNYQKELEKIIEQNQSQNRIPKLLLHSCCAPCSSYVLEYLSDYFEITVFYYNPNIAPIEEYEKRVEEERMLIQKLPTRYPVRMEVGHYDLERFYQMAKGLEEMPEGGRRCFGCYELRLRETGCIAREGGYDYFTTTLSISPLKNAQKLNEIGEKVGKELGIAYLPSDFKKKNGYKRSIELSNEYGLYRQNYCGCEFSKREV